MEYAVNLPNIFQSPGQALQAGTEQLQRQGENLAQLGMREREMAERKAERDQAEMFRKTQLIQEMTDLSKYQTANDVANALGYQKADETQKKWFDAINSGKVDLATLAQGIKKDVNIITQGMSALKTEHDQFDKGIQVLKQQYPDLNTTQLIKDYRQDVINRRLKGGEFINPLEVGQSEFVQNLSDPRFLSRYKMGNKSLREAIISPKGVEEVKVFTGTPTQNMRYDAKVPFWKKPSFTPEQVSGGFLPKGAEPKLQMKASKLSAEALPAAKGEFNIVDEDVYGVFAQDQNTYMDLINATRNKYPNYDTFSPQERQYAERNALYDQLTSLDQTNFIPAQSTRAPITKVSIPKEEKGIEGRKWIDDITKSVDNNDVKAVADRLGQLYGGKGFVKAVVNVDKNTGKITNADITLRKKEDGEEVDVTNKINLTDEYRDAVLEGVYQNVMGKDVKLKGYQPKSENVTSKTYTYQGKKYTEQQLSSAAKQSGMTLEEYKKALKL